MKKDQSHLRVSLNIDQQKMSILKIRGKKKEEN